MVFFHNVQSFNAFLAGMTVVAVVVFIALYFVKAGYGVFYNKKWGLTVSNKLGWILMEAPVFLMMTYLWLQSGRMFEPAAFFLFLMFQLHYIQRAFVFPFLIKGRGRMPVLIMLMAVVFNLCNALMQGGWIFYFAPAEMYTCTWFSMPQFWIGLGLFLAGMYVNIDSDRRIRGLRKAGDTKHYLPHGGMFEYVTSANYFGELVEWTGFAIMSWSPAGAVFAIWTFANLVPRADSIYKRYKLEFGEQVRKRRLKRIIPFIY